MITLNLTNLETTFLTLALLQSKQICIESKNGNFKEHNLKVIDSLLKQINDLEQKHNEQLKKQLTKQ